MKTINTTTFQEQLRGLQIVHLAFVVGVLLFLIVVSTLLTDPSNPIKDTIYDTLIFAVPIVAIAVYFAAKYVHENFYKKAYNKSLPKKLTIFQSTFLVQMILYEGAALFAIVATLITNRHIFLSIAGIMLLLMYLIRPTKGKVIERLQLNQEDLEALDA